MKSKPVVLKIYDATTSKKSKKELKARKDNAIRLGNDNYVMPIELEGDIDAMCEWYRITGLYTEAGLQITSNADTNIIARYCTAVSTYRTVIRRDKTPTVSLITRLQSMEDRLLLTPLAKFRYIPMIVKKDKKKEDLETLGFGGV